MDVMLKLYKNIWICSITYIKLWSIVFYFRLKLSCVYWHRCSIDSNFLEWANLLIMIGIQVNRGSRLYFCTFVTTIGVLQVKSVQSIQLYLSSISDCKAIFQLLHIYKLHISDNQLFRSSRCIRPFEMIRVSDRTSEEKTYISLNKLNYSHDTIEAVSHLVGTGALRIQRQIYTHSITRNLQSTTQLYSYASTR